MPPGPLVSADWLAGRLSDPDLRVVHVSSSRRVYDREHIPGAVFGALDGELGLRGTAPETGDAEREALVPPRDHLEATLARWGVGEGDRVVFYDDRGQNRHAVRGYWLLRLYRYPRERVHVLDGGLGAWQRAGGAVAGSAAGDAAGARPEAPRSRVRLGEQDSTLIATYVDVLDWVREAPAGGPARVLDMRTAAEFSGADVRSRRAGRVPGARHRPFEDLLAPDGTFRPLAEMLAIIRGCGAEPGELRATYCQTGARSALGWFVLHELAGFTDVRNYAGSWEEWGNRDDSPIEAG
ncbi:MAG TPA: rhodanese-like domain-containing protein [Candidatus Limnocylindrales bacterium]|nr:rhodanese-like domain-containing protein [Candidatus Limnocylindrales bacterium]